MPKRLARESGEIDTYAREEERRAVGLLEEILRRRGMTVRGVERMAGFGQGTLHAVLTGRSPVRVYHVAAVCQATGYPLATFYSELAGLAQATTASNRPSREVARGLTEDEILQSVRDLLRRFHPEEAPDRDKE